MVGMEASAPDRRVEAVEEAQFGHGHVFDGDAWLGLVWHNGAAARVSSDPDGILGRASGRVHGARRLSDDDHHAAGRSAERKGRSAIPVGVRIRCNVTGPLSHVDAFKFRNGFRYGCNAAHLPGRWARIHFYSIQRAVLPRCTSRKKQPGREHDEFRAKHWRERRHRYREHDGDAQHAAAAELSFRKHAIWESEVSRNGPGTRRYAARPGRERGGRDPPGLWATRNDDAATGLSSGFPGRGFNAGLGGCVPDSSGVHHEKAGRGGAQCPATALSVAAREVGIDLLRRQAPQGRTNSSAARLVGAAALFRKCRRDNSFLSSKSNFTGNSGPRSRTGIVLLGSKRYRG